MFGLIRKKKVIDALEHIKNNYDDCNKAPEGFGRINYFYYSWGNMNCANYIAKKLGIDSKVYVKR